MHRFLLMAGLSLAAALGPQAQAATAQAATAQAATAKAAAPHTPSYIEFNVADPVRAKAFYGAVFGWSFTDYGPDYASFATVGANGGFARGRPGGAGGPLMVFPVADLEGAQDRVKAAGGTVTKPIFSFPGGRRFHFRDMDGYEVAAWSEP
jgi:predicted enzyme related to lactoylglutathione lyase